MIKFFRKIRQNLLSEGKTGKYLKYAIGEIFLVVIGILIALGINNWNENKKTQEETKDYLERLLVETEVHIIKVNKEIESEKNQIKASKKLLSLFNQERENIKSKTLDSLIYTIYVANAIDLNAGIFNEGINGRIIGNLKSENLRSTLYGFVGLLQDLKRNEQMWSNDLNNNLGGFLNKNFNYRKMDNAFSRYKGEIGNSRFETFNNLSNLNNMEFENHIDNRFFINRLQLDNYQEINVELKKIKRLINEELKK